MNLLTRCQLALIVLTKLTDISEDLLNLVRTQLLLESGHFAETVHDCFHQKIIRLILHVGSAQVLCLYLSSLRSVPATVSAVANRATGVIDFLAITAGWRTTDSHWPLKRGDSCQCDNHRS